MAVSVYLCLFNKKQISMVMKNHIVSSAFFLFLSLLFTGFLSSCSDDDETSTGRTGTEVISLIKKHLYDNEGNVKAIRLTDYQAGEYALIADRKEDACEFFASLTGTDAPLNDTYEYQYSFVNAEGKSCKIRITGKATPQNGIYATLYFSIPDCSELRIIHIGTTSILNDTNGETDKTQDIVKVPVMG